MENQILEQTPDEEDFSIELVRAQIHGVNSTRNFLANLPAEDFFDLIEKNQSFQSFQQWMNYYLWLFRSDQEFQQIISHPKFPTKFLLQFIYFSLGKWISGDNEPDEFFMEIANLFSPEKCLQILIEEKVADLDVNLALALISNLDESGINYYFERTGNRDDETNFFYDLFSELEDSMIKSFFIKNPELYTHILQMFKKEKDKSEEHRIKFERFVEKFKVDLEIIDLTLDIKEKVIRKFDMEKEKTLPCSQRDLKRLVGIINALKDNKSAIDIVQILYRQKTIIDREEKELIRSILTDDYLRNMINVSENVKL
ncbi:MAG: hypothetical protein IPG24_19840 [Leptospiraceae bacterium]|nr:hypothetical protein [Leptospiraceae bacterium]